jgi:hypothetical protein
VVDRVPKELHIEVATYYTPSSYPPSAATTYTRHEPPIMAESPLGGRPESIAVNPADDHVFIESGAKILELDSAAKGSAIIRQFAPTITFASHSKIDVCGGTGDVYVASNPGYIYVVNAAGTQVQARIDGFDSPIGLLGNNPQIAVDQSNCHVLAYDPTDRAAKEFEASGAFVTEFGLFSEAPSAYELAIDNSGGPNDGTAYVVQHETGGFDVWAFGPLSYGEPPLATTGAADGLGAGAAALHGTVDPREFALTACRFEYLPDSAYLENVEEAEEEGHEEPEAKGFGFAGASTKACAESLASIGSGSGAVAVHADLTGLDPEGRYRFRLVAENKYGPGSGEASLFGPPVLTTQSALPVLYDEATLRARIDPAGLPTEYHFEYGGAAGGYDHATPSEELAPGDEAVAVGAPLTGLAEGTTYHFRLVVSNEAKTVEGPDQSFTTLSRRGAESCPNPEYRIGPSAQLPDCRAYELATPAETAGVSPRDGEGGSAFNNWLTPPRGPEAGERLSFYTRNTIPGFDGTGQYDGLRSERGAGPHPASGWSTQLISPDFVQSRTNGPSSDGISPDQLYSFWGINGGQALPGSLPVGSYLRTPAGFEALGAASLGTGNAVADHLSSGGEAIFSSANRLEEAAPAQGITAIYERSAGAASLQVLSLQPNGQPFASDAHYLAASEDGTAMVFRVGTTLYLRRGGATTQIATAGTFASLASGGERVFYEAGGDLFYCDAAAGPCAGPEASQEATKIAEDAFFVSVSPDGSRVLFSSEAALTGGEENDNGEEAEPVEPNLYSWDGASVRFVAILDPQDFVSFAAVNDVNLGRWTVAVSEESGASRVSSPSRATPDGAVFLFQSHAQLTAYENEGIGEVYRYAPGAPEGERLLCLSCDPSGAPASADALLQDVRSLRPGSQRGTLIANVTDDGRKAFFMSYERLLPEDANEAQDVYEWQANGVGSCKRQGGCLALISSGQGEGDSYLYSMSADGRDVFIWTEEKLVGQDVAGSKSLYDVREGGGIPDPPAKAPCEGDACQGSGSIPPLVSSPASATIRSEGNTSGGEGSARCRKGQRKVRRAGKTRCVKRKAHRHKANRTGRAAR